MKMKKYFLLALVVLTGIASSCKYDDDEVWDSVNDLANRVTALEEATKQLNSDIAALQSIVSALQKQVSVSQVETLADGYIIHFSDGTKATIKNGEDGKDGVNAPVINVAKENGKYYWTITIDGETEWLTDEAGNKLAVSGKDGSTGATGADGKTPVLGVDADGYWTIDGKRVKDASGNDLKAKGEDGDSQFEGVTSGDGYIVITMADGTTTYKLPLLAAVTYTGEGYADNVVTLAPNASTILTYAVPNFGEKYSAEVINNTDNISVSLNENTKKLTIKAGGNTAQEGKIIILYYNANQTITSVLTVKVATTVSSASDLQTQLTAGGTVLLGDDVTSSTSIDTKGATLDGAGNELSFAITSADKKNFGVITTGGTIRNISISGSSKEYNGTTYGFRAVYITSMTEDVYIEGAALSGTYPINVNISGSNYGLYVSDTELLGWTSYGSIKEAVFTNCSFGKNEESGLANLRPYANTTLTNCTIESGFTITRDKDNTKSFSITLDNCMCGEEKVTAANFESLLAGESGVYSLQTDNYITVIVDGVEVEWSSNANN